MIPRFIHLFTILLLIDVRTSDAIPFFTTSDYVRAPATATAIKHCSDVIRFESSGEYSEALESKLKLREELLSAAPRDEIALAALNHEIASLQRYLSLSQHERDEFTTAISFLSQAAAHIHLDNRPEIVGTLEKHASSVRRLCGDDYVQNDRLANIVIAAKCAFRQYLTVIDDINRLQKQNPVVNGIWPPESIRAEYLRSWVFKQLGDHDSSHNSFELALRHHKALVADARKRTGLDYDILGLDRLDIADMMYAQGEFEAAARVNAIHENIARAIHGQQSQLYAYSLIASAAILIESRNFPMATRKAAEAISLAKALHTDGDRFFADVLKRGGMVFYDADDHTNALVSLNGAYREYSNLNDEKGKIDVLVFTSYLKSRLNDRNGAEEASSEALKLSDAYSDDIDIQLNVLKCRANVLNEYGDVVAAVALLSTGIETNRAASYDAPNGHPKTAELLEDRSTLFNKLGDDRRAKADLEAARDILVKSVGPSHPQTKRVESKLKHIQK